MTIGKRILQIINDIENDGAHFFDIEIESSIKKLFSNNR